MSSPVVLIGLPALHPAYLKLRQQHIPSTHLSQVSPSLFGDLCVTPACSAESERAWQHIAAKQHSKTAQHSKAAQQRSRKTKWSRAMSLV
jgi:hypothetical protein